MDNVKEIFDFLLFGQIILPGPLMNKQNLLIETLLFREIRMSAWS